MTLETQIACLRAVTVPQPKAKYLEAFGEATNGHNKARLVKRIAWRMQVLAEGCSRSGPGSRPCRPGR